MGALARRGAARLEDAVILVADVGNTNTVCGLFEGRELVVHFRFRTEVGLTADELGLLLTQFLAVHGRRAEEVSALAVASVVPPLIEPWVAMGERYFGRAPFVVRAPEVGLPILLDRPEEVGVDRVLNALAGWERHRRALIIIDYGTATTFDCVSPEGAYLGGAIAPGLGLAAEGLFQKASMLPRVDLLRPPESAIGRDTLSALRSGLLLGFASLTDGLVERMAREFPERPLVLATGGLAGLMQGLSRSIERVEPFLTLEGLRIWLARRGL